MKRFRVWLIIALAAILVLMPATIFASDISNALWRGTIEVTNSGDTTATAVSVNMSGNSSAMIANSFATSNMSDVAIQLNGVDVPFMPGYDDSPWAIFVNSIGAGINLNYDLYTGGASNGTIRYFPGDEGMTTADSASLELGDNFTIEQSGWLNTSLTTGLGYISPDGFVDGGGTWASETNAYNDNTTDMAEESVGGSSWGNFLELTYSEEIWSDRLRFWADYHATYIDSVDLDAYYNGAWHDVYQGAFAHKTWVEKSLGDNYTLTSARVRFHANTAAMARLYEFDFYGVATNKKLVEKSGAITILIDGSGNVTAIISPVSVTATGVSSDEHTLRIWADTSYLHISVDGVESDNATLGGASIPDNSANWTFLQNDVMPYMEYQKIWVDGVLQQHIEWEYDTIFSDLSGNNHDATPTFRTTSSDADVSAELTSFMPADEAELSTFSISTAYSILTSTPDAPAQMYHDPEYNRIPGAIAINEMLTEADVPLVVWWYPFILLGICVIGFIVYGATTLGKQGNRRLAEGQVDGSLLTMFIVMEALLIVFGIMGPIPLWPAYLFPIAGVAIILSRKHFSWG